ncbi:MAG: DUF4124 domain-containing protein [Betaproteobacteria bacterium]
MRIPTLFGVFVAGFAALASLPATATMYKCTTRDGTVLYQARPCANGDKDASVASAGSNDSAVPLDAASRKLAENDARLGTVSARSPRETEQRAVLDRDLAQRRDRCRNYRDTIERQKPLFDSANEVTRQHALNEVKIQERRMKDDSCVAL